MFHMSKRWILSHRLLPMVVPGTIAATMRPVRCSTEPESEPRTRRQNDGYSIPAPSAPPPSPPGIDTEAVRREVRAILQSSGTQEMYNEAARRAVRGSIHPEVERAQREVSMAREQSEKQFRRKMQAIAEEVAQAAAREEVTRLHTLIESLAQAACDKELKREVPRAVQENPEMRRILSEQLERVRAEVHRAAENEIHRIVNEDQYHTVNKAFLDSLNTRAEAVLAGTEARAQQAVEQSKAGRMVDRLLSIGAVAVAGAAVYLSQQRSRL